MVQRRRRERNAFIDINIIVTTTQNIGSDLCMGKNPHPSNFLLKTYKFRSNVDNANQKDMGVKSECMYYLIRCSEGLLV